MTAHKSRAFVKRRAGCHPGRPAFLPIAASLASWAPLAEVGARVRDSCVGKRQ